MPAASRDSRTCSIVAFVAAALFYPRLFRTWDGFVLTTLIVPLIQIIMFRVGTTPSVGDFARVLAMSPLVPIGMLLQFGVMSAGGLGDALSQSEGQAPAG